MKYINTAGMVHAAGGQRVVRRLQDENVVLVQPAEAHVTQPACAPASISGGKNRCD